MTEKVNLKNLYKIFGPEHERAFNMSEDGSGKDDIPQKTGLTVGVHDADFSVESG